MKKYFRKQFLFFVGFFLSCHLFAQTYTATVYSVQPSAATGVDAVISSLSSTVNMGSATGFYAQRLSSGEKIRSLIYFDLSASIPNNAIVLSASLTLNGGSQSGTNASNLARVNASWAENTVTWNTINTSYYSGTGSTSFDPVSIATTTLTSINIDVKNHVQHMINVPAANFGWMLMLQNETSGTQALSFGSSDNLISSYRPRLTVTYELPVTINASVTPASSPTSTNGAITVTVSNGVTPYTYSWSNGASTQNISNVAPGMYTLTVTDANSQQSKQIISLCTGSTTNSAVYQPDGVAGNDAYFGVGDNGTYYLNVNGPNVTEYKDVRGTASGNWLKTRSAMQFDLSHIPIGATVNSASLILSGTSHNTISMSNASYLSVITSTWNEPSLTWNTKPTTNSLTAVSIPSTSTSTETKTVDVTSHVQNMVSNPGTNYGWELKLQNEVSQLYASMAFASSDHSNSAIRPQLLINYSYPCPSSLAITSSTNVPCAGTTVTLSVPSNTNVTFSWSGPGIVATGQNTATINASGVYTVTASYGCGTATTNISFITPTITGVPSSQSVCAGALTSANVFTVSPVGTTIAWTNNNTSIGLAASGSGSIAAFTASNVATQQIGSITATPSYSTCTGTSKTFSITVNPLPTASAGSNQTITCTNTLVTLTGTTNASSPSYSWSPAGNSPTTAVNTTSVAGTYTLKVTNTTNGCFNTGTVSVTSNTTIPTASAGSNQTITCTNTLVTLTGTTNASSPSYSWSPSGNSPTTAVNTTSVAGTYTLKVTNTTNGCFNTGTVSVTSNTTIPTASAGSNQTITCTNTLVTLTGTTNASSPSYSWSPSGNSPTTAVNTTSVAGTYTLKVTNTTNGCFNTGTVSVTSNTTIPTASAGSNQTITCTNTLVTLTGTTNASSPSYSWTPAGNSPTTAVNTTSVAGTYTLKVTNTTNGCFNTGTVSVTSNTTLPTASAGSNQTITCTNTLVTLTGTTNASSPSYSWSPSGNSPTTAVNTTSVAGTYTLKVTNTTNGCFNTGTVSVTSNTTIPTASAGSNQTITCTNTLVTLTGTTNASSPSYSWSPSGNSPTTAVNTTSVAGTYTLKVTNTTNGCFNTGTVSVISNTTIPTASAGNDQIITCTNTLVTLTGTTNASSPSYSWTPAGNSPTTAMNTTSVTGIYIFKVTDISNGCSNIDTAIVSQIIKSYSILNKKIDAQNYSLFCNKLYFKIEGEYDQSSLSYKIYKYDHTLLTGLSINSTMLNHGDNRYEIDLSSIISDSYVLEVTNQNNEKRYLRFTK